MHSELNCGIPTVTVQAEFVSPSRLGDMLDISLTLRRVGQSSLDIDVSYTCEGQLRARFSKRIVYIDSLSGQSQPWPTSLRHALNNYLTDTP